MGWGLAANYRRLADWVSVLASLRWRTDQALHLRFFKDAGALVIVADSQRDFRTFDGNHEITVLSLLVSRLLQREMAFEPLVFAS